MSKGIEAAKKLPDMLGALYRRDELIEKHAGDHERVFFEAMRGMVKELTGDELNFTEAYEFDRELRRLADEKKSGDSAFQKSPASTESTPSG